MVEETNPAYGHAIGGMLAAARGESLTLEEELAFNREMALENINKYGPDIYKHFPQKLKNSLKPTDLTEHNITA